MAPEVALGEREIGARVDIYALGCVAYWLVTGHMVFRGETAMQVALHHVQTVPVPPSKRTELAIPERPDRLILSCLEKDPTSAPRARRSWPAALRPVRSSLPGPERAKGWWEAHVPVLGETTATAG